MYLLSKLYEVWDEPTKETFTRHIPADKYDMYCLVGLFEPSTYDYTWPSRNLTVQVLMDRRLDKMTIFHEFKKTESTPHSSANLRHKIRYMTAPALNTTRQ